VPADSASRDAQLVLFGGQIAAGKTAAARGVAERGGSRLVLVRRALEEILGGVDWDRRRLQIEGAALDERSHGRWLLDYLLQVLDADGRVVVDAARTRRQVEPIMDAVPTARLIFLAASESTRRRRYRQAAAVDPVKRTTPFDEAMAHPTESEALTIRAMASLVINTDELTGEEVVDEVCRFLSW
jgi:P-loop ATPase family protein